MWHCLLYPSMTTKSTLIHRLSHLGFSNLVLCCLREQKERVCMLLEHSLIGTVYTELREGERS